MVDKNQIYKAFDESGTDKHSVHGYHRWYAKVFDNYTPNSIMEIGVMQGRSLASWRTLFPNVAITGVDITNKKIKREYIEYSDAKIVIGDSTNSKDMKEIDSSYDIIIDDGSHFYKNIIRTFNVFKDKFNYAYIIEDAMYKQNFTLKCLKRMGFNNIKVYPSLQKNIPVSRNWLETGKYGGKGKVIFVDLYMIVVYKD